MVKTTVVDSFARLIVWSWVAGNICTSGYQQTNYQTIKRVLLLVYQISSQTHRKKVFDQTFNPSNPDQWLREYSQNFHQWLDSTKRPTREVVLMELLLAKLPGWLKTQMRNQNYQNYEELTEAIIGYLGNQKIRKKKNIRKKKIIIFCKEFRSI